jgi:DNA-binding NarL/FixJ family response regulator
MPPWSSGWSRQAETTVTEPTTSRRVSLLVVDDHRLFADLLATRLQREPGVVEVTSAYSVDEAGVVAHRTPPDVVLLDYHLEDGTGTALIPALQELRDPPAVVMLSASEEPDDVIDSLASGAAAWVVKGARVEVLMTAIDEVLHERMYLHPTTVRPVVERLLQDTRERTVPTFVDTLSERQLEVLRCLVAGMNRAEVAQRLFISPNTARTHVQNLMQAAGEHSTLALVARARSLGVAPLDGPVDRPVDRE